uniref:Fe2OG dioxygenase domain-containing protein n=1 Tax=Ditylum brightwellii TaxID=49249 RepID=A0A7S4QY55_9STRA
MDALVSHSCLIVDLSDGGTSYQSTMALSKMWEATSTFFTAIDENPELETSTLPSMDVAEGAGSIHEVVGYASYKDGDTKFVETRFKRGEKAVMMPAEVETILGADSIQSIAESFDAMVGVGKDVVRIATAASSMEVDAFVERNKSSSSNQPSGYMEEDEKMPFISGLSLEDAVTTGLVEGIEEINDEDNWDYEPSENELTLASIRASEAAIRLADELIDDSNPLKAASIEALESTAVGEGSVSMSPHRLCRYSNTQQKEEVMDEVFGAHTDTTFVTLIPAASVSGLEVYDEDAAVWFRPELMARKHWEAERRERGEDPSALTETIQIAAGDDETEEVVIPWHARYLIVMPGELLQLTSRNEIPAAVHRVVAAREGQSRLSAPVLLRARTGIKMNVERYFGNLDVAGPLLMECQGIPMEDLHDAMQPSSMQKQ